MKPDAGTSPTGLKMADKALHAASTSLPAETTAVTLPAVPDQTRFSSFPRIITTETTKCTSLTPSLLLQNFCLAKTR